eukprot:scaffold10413_cov26-Cyclotella_meneghiniana.AAC.2
MVQENALNAAAGNNSCLKATSYSSCGIITSCYCYSLSDKPIKPAQRLVPALALQSQLYGPRASSDSEASASLYLMPTQ